MSTDPLIRILVDVGLRPSRGGDYLKMYCPFHPNPSGRTLWVAHDTGAWGCFSSRCPYHPSGGGLAELLTHRGMDSRVAVAAARGLDLKAREHRDRPESMADRDAQGRVTEAHVACWVVDWYLAAEVCAAILRAGADRFAPEHPVRSWAPGCRARPGQVEHDHWQYLWYLLVHRGLSPHALDLMEVGLDAQRGLLVFPLRGPDGVLRGVARREATDGGKYILDGNVWKRGELESRELELQYFVEVDRGSTFFGWSAFARRIEAGEPVVVVEGYADQLRLAGLGYCAVAKMGASMTKQQLDLLRGRRVVIWPDFDKPDSKGKRPGLEGSRREAVALLAESGVALVTTSGGVKDPGTLGVDARVAGAVLASAVPPAIWLARFAQISSCAH